MRAYIRTARPSDRETVFKFTAHTWDWGDYIPDVWNTWLSEPGGRIFIVTLERVPTGIEHIIMVRDDEAWLEGLRVDPAYRCQGIAMKLTERCVDKARLFGAHAIRFLTSSLNPPVHKIAATLGFKLVAVIQPMVSPVVSPAIEGQKATIVKPTKGTLKEINNFILNSTSLKEAAGLYSTGWRFCKLTPEEIARKLDEGAIRVISDGNDIKAAGIFEKRSYGNGLAISYAGGTGDAVSKLAVDIRSEAAGSHVAEVSTRLPATSEIESAFTKAGYQKSDEHPFWIFEKNLTE